MTIQRMSNCTVIFFHWSFLTRIIMEIKLDVDYSEFDKLIALMEEFPRGVQAKVAGDGMLAAAKVVAAEARRTVAFEDQTGALRDSIRTAKATDWFMGKKYAGSAAKVIAGGSDAAQAWHMEMGYIHHTGKVIQARPFMEPALNNTLKEQLNACVSAMRVSFLKLARAFASGKTTASIRRIAGN